MSEGIEAIKETKNFLDKAKRCPTCGRLPADLIITDVPTKTLEIFRKLQMKNLVLKIQKGIMALP